MKMSEPNLHKNLKDSELLKRTVLAAKHEKAATIALLEYLVEVDSRRLYATVNACSSLFEYLVNELGFSEPSAADRVNTIRLMRAVPEVKGHLETGSLTLTSAAQIQRFVNAEQKVHPLGKAVSLDEKIKVVNECLGKSKREVEKTLFEQQSEPARILTQEKVKFVTSDRAEIKFATDKNFLMKLNQVRDLTGEQSLEKIFEKALDALISSEQKKRGYDSKKKMPLVSGDSKNHDADFNRPAELEKESTRPVKLNQEGETRTDKQLNSRFIAIDLKRLVHARSNGQCEFVDPRSRKRCQSTFRLQIDHIIPLVLGGKTESNNLRHLCATHNQRMAIQMGLKRPEMNSFN